MGCLTNRESPRKGLLKGVGVLCFRVQAKVIT
jgi:hypothetical protein